MDVVKSYYSHSAIIALYQLENQTDLINELNDLLKESVGKLAYMSELLIGEDNTCLFSLIAEFAIEVVNSDGNNQEFMEIMDSIIEEINKIDGFFSSRLGRKVKINRKRMEEAYHLIITGTKDREMSAQTYLKYSVEDAEKTIVELTYSYQQILNYSGIDKDKAQKMQNTMSDFVNLKDRLSIDDNARKIRKQLTEEYYELYKEVFLKAYHDKNVPRIIEMFLEYGYADERLLTNEQLLSIYFLKKENVSGNLHVYNIREWLQLIYEGKKEPSKNEFDQEYNEMLMSMKNKGKPQIADKGHVSDMSKNLNTRFRICSDIITESQMVKSAPLYQIE